MQIYLGRGVRREGPFSLEEVQARLAEGLTRPGDLAWFEGAPNWMPVRQVPGLEAARPMFQPQPALLPVQPLVGSGKSVRTGRQSGPPLERYAITSLVLGVLGFFVPIILSIPGAIFGHLGLGRIQRSKGTVGGRGLALAGVIVSYVGMVMWIAAIVVIAKMMGESPVSGVRPRI